MVNPPGSGVPGAAPSIVTRVGKGKPGESESVTFSISRLRTSTVVAASMLLMNVARLYKPGRTLRITNCPVAPSTVPLYRFPASVQCRPQFHVERRHLNGAHRILDNSRSEAAGIVRIWHVRNRRVRLALPVKDAEEVAEAVSVRRDCFEPATAAAEFRERCRTR